MRLRFLAAAGLLAASMAAHADQIVDVLVQGTSAVYFTGPLTVLENTGTFQGSGYFDVTTNQIYLQYAGGVGGSTQLDDDGTYSFMGLYEWDSIYYHQYGTYGFGELSHEYEIRASYTDPYGNYFDGRDDFIDVASITAVQATPEPSSIALLGTGLLGIAGVMRKRFV